MESKNIKYLQKKWWDESKTVTISKMKARVQIWWNDKSNNSSEKGNKIPGTLKHNGTKMERTGKTAWLEEWYGHFSNFFSENSCLAYSWHILNASFQVQSSKKVCGQTITVVTKHQFILYFTCEATAQGLLASVSSPTSSSSSSSSKSSPSSSFGGDAINGNTTDNVGKRSLFFTSAYYKNIHWYLFTATLSTVKQP